MAINNYIKWPAERIRQDENNRLISDIQITTWNGKADSDHSHDDKYIPLTGSTALSGNIYPSEPTKCSLGNPNLPFGMVCCHNLYIRDSDGSKGRLQINNDLGIIFGSKNTNGAGYFDAPDEITAGTR